jgi:cold shock CspA family protein
MAIGTVRTLISGKRFGFIHSSGDDANYVFDDSAVVGGAFDTLRIGQWVRFDEGADPCEAGYRRARHVRPDTGASN